MRTGTQSKVGAGLSHRGSVPCARKHEGIDPLFASLVDFRMHTEVADASQKLYICPGETEPISYSVHLGRLARLYPACQHCPLNCETGSAGEDIVERLEEKSQRQRDELKREFGTIRGVYLNQIDRRVAGDIVGQFADQLWAETHRAVRTHRRERIDDWHAPLVAIGYDQRPSSPDIVTGLQNRLRLMGCNVVDIGLATGPALQYAVRFHKASSGVFVSGSGCSTSWTGLDFFGADGQPTDVSNIVVPRAGSQPLDHARPVRWSGRHRFEPIHEGYSLRLRRFVRPKRPLTVCVGTEDHVTGELVGSTLRELNSGLHLVDLPKRVRDLSNFDDPDVRRIGEAVAATNADLGFVIDEDARRCMLIDDRGEAAYSHETAALISNLNAVDSVDVIGETFEFPQQTIRCDAILTLAHAITAASRLDGSLSGFIDNCVAPTV